MLTIEIEETNKMFRGLVAVSCGQFIHPRWAPSTAPGASLICPSCHNHVTVKRVIEDFIPASA